MNKKWLCFVYSWCGLLQYLILGTVKSEGSFEIFTICGRLGNFSKIRNRRGSFSLVSALASLCFSCWEKPEESLETYDLFSDSIEGWWWCVFTRPSNGWRTAQNGLLFRAPFGTSLHYPTRIKMERCCILYSVPHSWWKREKGVSCTVHCSELMCPLEA